MDEETVMTYIHIAGALNSLDANNESLKTIACAILDLIANKMKKTGYELLEEIMPFMKMGNVEKRTELNINIHE